MLLGFRFLRLLNRRSRLRSTSTRDGVSSLVVCVETLRLECHEEGAVFGAGILENKAAVAKDAIIARVTLVVPLIHVDVVNSIAGSKFEVLILLRFRTPSHPECV